MTNPFGNVSLSTEGLEKQEDRLGGGGGKKPSDIYQATVKLFYATKSEKGAHGVVMSFILPDGSEYSETVYITNRKGENFYLDKNDNTKKVPLPGFSLVNNVALLTAEKQLAELEWEEKNVKVYDFEAKKEVPQAVMCATEVMGQKIALGLLHILENKTALNEATGAYEAIAEEREINQIDRVFHPEAMVTVTEALEQELEEGEFYKKWLEKFKTGAPVDRRKIKDGQGGVKSGAPGKPSKPAPGASDAAPAPKKSLFGSKK